MNVVRTDVKSSEYFYACTRILVQLPKLGSQGILTPSHCSVHLPSNSDIRSHENCSTVSQLILDFLHDTRPALNTIVEVVCFARVRVGRVAGPIVQVYDANSGTGAREEKSYCTTETGGATGYEGYSIVESGWVGHCGRMRVGSGIEKS